MKPLSPHDPFDDLIAAALHGELTVEERIQFDARLKTDSAARAAYQEAQLMHDLLEKSHKEAQPDPAFEQRMVSGVHRKIQHDKQHAETAWQSLLFFWNGARGLFNSPWTIWKYSAVCGLLIVVVGFGFAIRHDARAAHLLANNNGIANPSSHATDESFFLPRSLFVPDFKRRSIGRRIDAAEAKERTEGIAMAGYYLRYGTPINLPAPKNAPELLRAKITDSNADGDKVATDTTSEGTIRGRAFTSTAASSGPQPLMKPIAAPVATTAPLAAPAASDTGVPPSVTTQSGLKGNLNEVDELSYAHAISKTLEVSNGQTKVIGKLIQTPDDISSTKSGEASAPDTRKLIRNAQLDLEVKSFQSTIDRITALTKSAGGYVDTSNSQKGGNGKLQGTIVVKVLPQNLDDFLLKLRDLGQVQNQSVSTDDVTKDYFDTQARLENSRRMETQLQNLLKHENSKVSDLLQVERELGRVRGEIEQMQGQLKLYDFQVQYATVTMQVSEKDLNQTAAYLLKEQDEFSLFATDVEGTFQKARQTADNSKAQVLTANLNHNSGSDVSAELVVMVAPDQIEPFLSQVRSLGRVANFTRQTQRVAKDGGDSDQPADQTLTEKDKVQVHLAIRSDDESRKQVALTVVAKAVDDALDQAKTAALANAGAEILNSSLNKTPQGQSSAQLSVRVPGKDYAALMEAFRALGRTASLSIQRNDNSGPGANGDDTPVIVSLSLTDDDTPLQATEISVLASDVDSQAQQIKKDASASGVEVKASSFERQPDGTELAQMVFRLPISKYPAFLETLKKLGKVESLSVSRNDRPDQTRTDESAPAEISLQLHNQRDIVADNSGMMATLRQTFGEGAAALFGSVRVIGVVIAFLMPWVVTLIVFAWIARRIYIWRKK
jgi:hypothetical protein